jgi:hypothetical protein
MLRTRNSTLERAGSRVQVPVASAPADPGVGTVSLLIDLLSVADDSVPSRRFACHISRARRVNCYDTTRRENVTDD